MDEYVKVFRRLSSVVAIMDMDGFNVAAKSFFFDVYTQVTFWCDTRCHYV